MPQLILIFIEIYLISLNIIYCYCFNQVCYLRVDTSHVVSGLETQLCTHIILAFASVSNSEIVANNLNDEIIYGQLISQIKRFNNQTIIMLSVGGGGNDQGFHTAVSSNKNMKMFAESAVKLMEQFDLDGIDIDWEFPVWGTGFLFDKYRFNSLLRELRNKFDVYYTKRWKKSRILLSVAVSASLTIINTAYYMPEMINYVDFINLMSYDYNLFKWYTPFAGHNSPLTGGSLSTFSTEWSANYWHELGAHKSKIMVGIPTYGRAFRLASKLLTAPMSPAIADAGDLTMSQVCAFLAINGTVKAFDIRAKVPYAYNAYSGVWITYEDEESAQIKTLWTLENGFGGVMTFSLNADDHENMCAKNVRYLIHYSISSAVKKYFALFR